MHLQDFLESFQWPVEVLQRKTLCGPRNIFPMWCNTLDQTTWKCRQAEGMRRCFLTPSSSKWASEVSQNEVLPEFQRFRKINGNSYKLHFTETLEVLVLVCKQKKKRICRSKCYSVEESLSKPRRCWSATQLCRPGAADATEGPSDGNGRVLQQGRPVRVAFLTGGMFRDPDTHKSPDGRRRRRVSGAAARAPALSEVSMLYNQ